MTARRPGGPAARRPGDPTVNTETARRPGGPAGIENPYRPAARRPGGPAGSDTTIDTAIDKTIDLICLLYTHVSYIVGGREGMVKTH